MPIVVEDGTGLNPAANSYVSYADAAAYALARGLPFPSDEDIGGQQLMLAMDYLEAKRGDYIGVEVVEEQPLAWPRVYCPTYGLATSFLSGVSPLVIKAQCELASICGTINLFPDQDSPQITKEQVGPLVTEYSERNGTSGSPYLPKITDILRPILEGGGNTLRVYRA